MNAPPELDHYAAQVLAQPMPTRTPARELVERAQRRRRRRRSSIAALGAVVAVGVVAAAVAIGRPSSGRGVQVATKSPTTVAVPAASMESVTCTGNVIHVSARVVQAQPDGVHLRITFTRRGGGSFGYLTPGTDFAGDPDLKGAGWEWLSPGPWTEIQPLAPGKNVLHCTEPDTGVPATRRTIEVVDPHHYWKPIPYPKCHLTMVGPVFSPGTSAVKGVRNWLAQKHRAEDRIAVLGYPRDDVPSIVVSHDGKLVARVNVFRTTINHGSWQIQGFACRGF